MPRPCSIDWTAKDPVLRALLAQGVTQRQIAAQLGVTPGAVSSRLYRLGLVKSPPSVALRKARLKPKPKSIRVAVPPAPVGDLICPKRMVRRLCAEAFGVSEQDLIGFSRRREISIPRQATFYVLRQRFPEMSYPRIARLLGGRDHSTIIHGCLQTIERMKRDPELARTVQALITPFHDAHVETWRAHNLRAAEAVHQSLDAARAAETHRTAQIAREPGAPDERALAVLEGPVKVFCGQCDRAVTLASAERCQSRFCGLKTQGRMAA